MLNIPNEPILMNIFRSF